MQKKTTNLSCISKAYLVIYNLISALGWLFVLTTTAQNILSWRSVNDFFDGKNIYVNIRSPLKILLATAFVEIIHAWLKLVKSSPIITFNQVFIRFLVIWGITENFYTAQHSYGIVILGLIWSLSEITRYFYYIFNTVQVEVNFLKWCRYSLFLVLYPLGILGEIVCILMAARFVEPLSVRAEYSFYLPNVLNISYDFYYILWIWMFLYMPGFPIMYNHMRSQRKKYLSSSNQKHKKEE